MPRGPGIGCWAVERVAPVESPRLCAPTRAGRLVVGAKWRLPVVPVSPAAASSRKSSRLTQAGKIFPSLELALVPILHSGSSEGTRP